MAEKVSKTHAQAIERMKDQLLIVLIERFGGDAYVHVNEIDATGDRNLLMSIRDGGFHFSVRPKGPPVAEDRSIDIAKRPDYDEH